MYSRLRLQLFHMPYYLISFFACWHRPLLKCLLHIIHCVHSAMSTFLSFIDFYLISYFSWYPTQTLGTQPAHFKMNINSELNINAVLGLTALCLEARYYLVRLLCFDISKVKSAGEGSMPSQASRNSFAILSAEFSFFGSRTERDMCFSRFLVHSCSCLCHRKHPHRPHSCGHDHHLQGQGASVAKIKFSGGFIIP